MSHMVIYRSVDGKPGFQQTDDLVSAVEFVERLRNLEGVESARIYRLEQVNFRFQPYYQVHLDTDAAPAPPPLTVSPAAATPEPAPVADPAPVVSPAAMAAAAESTTLAAAAAAQGTVLAGAAHGTTAVAAAHGSTLTEDAPTLGATPAPEPNDGNGIRRGLFGR